MSTTTVNGQVIGQAHYATRAVLERVLAGSGTTFHQSVALNAAADSGEAIDHDRLIDRMTSTLKIDESAARATITELTEAGLLETLPGEQPRAGITDAGKALNHQIRTAVKEITARLYGGLSAEDLAVAGRVLTAVTARANAELAAAPSS